ncbi:ABC transporter substrate-binding protein [Maritalea mediterranea]|uniref:ABC transporter substrate-binding protein n=1 Tax=Maritalea mediterranea TaxID=2909667 RepID=A0ABS9E5R0_9HYPH|nr:ABC transporter substrate-binding protein [Maritalea mediterranea]MCF4098147.1 ABC transporter substrate-binding protein [Maritalea mediterranea]
MKQLIRHLLVAILVLSATTLAKAHDFPLTIEHKFGTTTIEKKPQRVASIDYAGADDLLALGIQPVTIRYWYGDYEEVVWPWAAPLLTTEPTVLRGDLDFEAIAAAKPDVIIGLWSGISAEDYERLSLIAPVVAVPKGVGDYALPWDERALITAHAVGKEELGQQKVQDIRDQLAEVKDSHPDWVGKTVAVATAWDGTPGVYASNDIRPLLMSNMGFVTPQKIDDAVGDAFWTQLSPEDLSPLDTDVLIWLSSDGNFQPILDLAARPFLAAVKDGHEVFLGKEVTGAFSHASLLSLPYTIDRLVPTLEAALDGDPATHADDRN